MKRLMVISILFLLAPYSLALSPTHLWSYTDECAVFSLSINDEGYISLAFGYYAELLSPNGTLLMKAPTRGIAYSTALSDNNVVLIGTEGNWVQAFSSSGKLLWEYRTADNVVSVAVSKDGRWAAAGDASGYTYFFKDGKLSWKKKVGDYVWKVSIKNDTVLAGSTGRIVAFQTSGSERWTLEVTGDVRDVIPTNRGVGILIVPKSENWATVELIGPNKNVLWSVNFSRYVRKIESDGENIAVAGMTGKVVLISINSGRVVYSSPLAMYANDVGTLGGYTIVSGGRIAQLIAPNGSVVWFKKFNGTVYHVAFSPKGYFLTEYGSHDVQNCYSNITAWSLSGKTYQRRHLKEGGSITFNIYTGVILIAIIAFLGVLLWKRGQ